MDEIKKLANLVLRDLKKGIKIEDAMDKYNLDQTELNGILELLELSGYEFQIKVINNQKSIKTKNNYPTVRIIKPEINALEHIKLMIISDTHMGNVLEQRTLINKAYEEAYKRGITEVLHCGDVVDGDYRNKRPAHPYDLFAQGSTQQLVNVVANYPKVDGIKTYFITGSHDETHFLNGGFKMGGEIAERRKDLIYLGPNQSMFYAGKAKVPILIRHPGGGCSKSLSYKAQEAINKIDEKNKPKVLLMGHFHKSYCMYYNDIYALLVPCLVDQTEFMKVNDLQNIVGAVFLDLYVDKKGNIEYFNYDEMRFTDKDIIKNDYLTSKRLLIKKR